MVGPEAPLVAGVADALAARRHPLLRPERRGRAARGLEGVLQGGDGRPPACRRPRIEVVTDVEAGIGAITGYPTVIKADGLAAGKGVIIAADESEARAALEALLVERRFGTERVVVEEYLDGRGAVAAGAVRRRDRAAARLRPGLQADLRRRPRAEHRRDGLLLAGAGDRRRPRARARRADPPAGAGRAGPRGASRSTACCTRA